MKYIFFFLLFSPFCFFAQPAEIFKIDSLPTQGIVLDKNWKWHAGDNPDFARPDYDDKLWQSINPAQDIFALPQIDKKTGQIGWFRIRLRVDSTVTRQLVLQLNQSGASELYLNGKLIHQFGVISNNPRNIKAFNPNNTPISFPVLIGQNQVLSIRYTLQPNILYGTDFGTTNKALSVTLNSTENGIKNYNDNLVVTLNRDFFRVAVYAIMFILFFTLYLFFPIRKVNLYFSVYTAFISLGWLLIFNTRFPNYTASLYWLNNVSLILQVIANIFMLTAVYSILEQKRGWFYGFGVLLGLVSILFSMLIYGWGWLIFGFAYTNYIAFEITRVAVVAVRGLKKGAWIMVIAGVIYFIAWVIFTLQFNHIISLDAKVEFALFDISMLVISVAFAIFLGYDFGFTNRLLVQKLKENENLFAEKQQMLATQNETLEKQVTQRTTELNKSLTELKFTQAQLVQKEKLASLGELTAGIAHEIQNPLNFVNNFSELSVDLAKELKDEIGKVSLPEKDKDYIGDIIHDLTANQEKINHHGKRASSIVKGMLEHSRTSTGVREMTDINKLADEYLRLSYHGLRAKDKNFNADYQTDFDEALPKINLVPQDIGRVLLNLINNAFWAVNQKRIANLEGERQLSESFKLSESSVEANKNEGERQLWKSSKLFQSSEGERYAPLVIVTTKKIGDTIEIKVKDNGNGIPKQNLEKIFQPFFTTKPTGEGTGLGLSLSYDIITKGHGGELKVESEVGVGSEFVILLPMK